MATIKEKIDIIAEATNTINSMLDTIGKVTNGKYSLHLNDTGKKKKKTMVTVCININELHD